MIPNRGPERTINMGLGAIVALVLVLAVIAGFHQHRASAALDQVLDHHVHKLNLVMRLRHIVHERVKAMQAVYIDPDPFARDATLMRLNELASAFLNVRRELESMPATAEERAALKDLRELTLWATAIHQRLLNLYAEQRFEEARRHLVEESLPAQREVLSQYDAIVRLYDRQVMEVQADVQAAGERATWWVIGLGLLTMLATAGIAARLARLHRNDRRQLTEQVLARQQAAEELERARDGLERQVQQRTRELRRNVALLAEAQRLGNIGHWHWVMETDELEWSDEVYRIFGIQRDQCEVRYEAFMHMVHPVDRPAVEAAVTAALTGDDQYDIEHRIIRPDGAERIVHERGRVHRDGTGAARGMIGTVQDVTAFREAEKEGRLGADVFRHTSDAIVVLDTDYRVVDANPAFSRLLERESETILGGAIDHLLSFEGEGSEWRTKIDAEGGWRGEAVCRPDAAASLPVYVTLNAVRDAHDQVLSYVAICRDISAEKANQQQLWHVANHDSLTGLPNRNLFMDRVQQAERIARRNQSQFALLLLDLDGFKQVNDSRGHAVGDALLNGVAARLTELVRDSDTVARLAGDEFTVLLTDVRDRDALAGFVSQLIARVSDPYLIENEPTTITVSAGIALYPEDADSASSLLRNADQAMYDAKRAGKNRCSFFADSAPD